MEFGPYLMLGSLKGAMTAAVLTLTALGLSLVFGVMRVVDVSHGEFFMLDTQSPMAARSLKRTSPVLCPEPLEIAN